MDFIIKDKIIKLDKASLEGKKVVSVNSGYVANFIFDEEWDGLIKTVRFINDGDIADWILDDTNSCKIPSEVMKSGVLEVGVYAGDVLSTTVARVPIVVSILDESGFPVDPTPDVYAQILTLLNRKNGINFVQFDVNTEDGNLYLTTHYEHEDFSFELNENGDLEVIFDET